MAWSKNSLSSVLWRSNRLFLASLDSAHCKPFFSHCTQKDRFTKPILNGFTNHTWFSQVINHLPHSKSTSKKRFQMFSGLMSFMPPGATLSTDMLVAAPNFYTQSWHVLMVIPLVVFILCYCATCAENFDDMPNEPKQQFNSIFSLSMEADKFEPKIPCINYLFSSK